MNSTPPQKKKKIRLQRIIIRLLLENTYLIAYIFMKYAHAYLQVGTLDKFNKYILEL